MQRKPSSLDCENRFSSKLWSLCIVNLGSNHWFRRLYMILFLFPSLLMAQSSTMSTMGQDFWVGFLPNYQISGAQLSLLISGPSYCTGVITGPITRTPFVVTPGHVTVVTVPDSMAMSSQALHVTTNMPVSLYASNYFDASYDVTNVLPTPTLGTDYVLQAYPDGQSEFAIIATQGSTKAYYYHPTIFGTEWVLDSVYLQAGEMFTYESPLRDISGTHIWTNDCRPMAVFTGNECINIPNGYSACDHIYEQSVPTSYWGRRFVVTSSQLRTHDRLRITALRDTTLLNVGGTSYSLNARQTLELDINSSTSPAVYVESTKPVCTFLYLTSVSYGGQYGDPSYCVIHPIEQQMAEATFSTFYTARSSHHFVNIAINSTTIGHILLDGALIPDTAFHLVPGHPEYAYAKIQLNHGSHSITALQDGFNAQVYGLGSAESYSYSVGGSLDLINGKAWLNNIPSMSLDSTNNRFCIGDVLHFRAMVVNEADTRISWEFDDGTNAFGVQADHAFERPGDYQVKANFVAWDGCSGVQTLELTLPVHIITPDHYITDTVVCDNMCRWHDTIVFDTGSYSHYESVESHQCDVLFTLNLRWIDTPPKAAIEMDYDCQRYQVELKAETEGDWVRWSSMPNDPDLAGHEFDSVVVVSADTWRRYYLESGYDAYPACADTIHFDKMDIKPLEARAVASPMVVSLDRPQVSLSDRSINAVGRNWFVGGESRSSQEHFDFSYPVNEDSLCVVLDAFDTTGCHDRDSLMLHINKEGLWVPSAFTPGQEENNRFEVKGINVTAFEIWVYNRDGQMVWHGDDLSDSWDGSCDGQLLPGGAYVYKIRYTCRFTPKITQLRTGTILLLR